MPVMVARGGKKVYLQLGMIFNGHWLDSVEQEKAACEFETAVVRHTGRIQRDMLRIKRPMNPIRSKDPDFIGMEEAYRIGLMHKDMVLTVAMISNAVERLMQPTVQKEE